MSKTIYNVCVLKRDNKTDCPLSASAFYSIEHAMSSFKETIKHLMCGEFSYAYSGVKCVPAFRHELTSNKYALYRVGNPIPLVEVYCLSTTLTNLSTSASASASAATASSPSSSTPTPVGPVCAPGPVVTPSSAPKVPAKSSSPTSGVVVNLPGVGAVTLDPTILGKAVARALSGSASGGSAAPSCGDPNKDEDDEENEEDD